MISAASLLASVAPISSRFISSAEIRRYEITRKRTSNVSDATILIFRVVCLLRDIQFERARHFPYIIETM